VIARRDVAVTSYDASPATLYTTLTTDGRTYYVVVIEEAGIAIVQPEGCSGWVEVSLSSLGLDDDTSDLQMASAVIDASFNR
jgi:hypothetical protein